MIKRVTKISLATIFLCVLQTAVAGKVFDDEEINPNPIINAPDNQFVQIVYAIFRLGGGTFLNPCFGVYLGKEESRNITESCKQSFRESVSSAADDAGIKPPPKPGENPCKYSCNFKLMKYSLDPRVWSRAVSFLKTDAVLARGYEGITRGALEDPDRFESALKAMVKQYQK